MRRGTVGLVVGVLAVAVALAFFVSPRASREPDGLERVAIDQGFADEARPGDHGLGYSASTGVLGVLVTFAVAGGVLVVVRKRSGRRTPV